MGQTRIALTLCVTLCLCLAWPAWGASNVSAPKKPPRPTWTELTPAQQQVLAPLASEWEQLDTIRRKKWVKIADRYPRMKPKEQQRLQQRMAEWTKLTPAERKAARERYQRLKKLPPEKRQQVRQQWRESQQQTAAPATEGAQPAEPTLAQPLAPAQPPASALSPVPAVSPAPTQPPAPSPSD